MLRKELGFLAKEYTRVRVTVTISNLRWRGGFRPINERRCIPAPGDAYVRNVPSLGSTSHKLTMKCYIMWTKRWRKRGGAHAHTHVRSAHNNALLLITRHILLTFPQPRATPASFVTPLQDSTSLLAFSFSSWINSASRSYNVLSLLFVTIQSGIACLIPVFFVLIAVTLLRHQP